MINGSVCQGGWQVRWLCGSGKLGKLSGVGSEDLVCSGRGYVTIENQGCLTDAQG